MVWQSEGKSQSGTVVPGQQAVAHRRARRGSVRSKVAVDGDQCQVQRA